MQIKHRQVVYILCLASFIFALPWSLAFADKSVFVEGDESLLPLLTYTKYFIDKPLFFFKDQLDHGLLEKVDAIIINDSTHNNIIFRLMKWIELKQGDNEIFIEDEGVYDIFVNREQMLEKKVGCFKITSNQKQFFISSQRLSLDGQLVKIKELSLDKGKNIIKIDGKEVGMIFFLGNQKNYLELKNQLKNKEFCYIFEKKKTTFYIF